MEKENNPWKTISEETAYENAWIRVEHHEVLNPAGNPGIYGKVHYKNTAISIVAVDSEGFTYLVGQFRYTLNAYSWEIPEGGGSRLLEPLESAKRELLEEVGIEALDWQLIQELDLSNSATDEVAYTFLARNLTYKKAQPEDSEQLTIKKIPFQSFYEMVEKGEIRDAITVSACYKVKMMLLEGKI